MSFFEYTVKTGYETGYYTEQDLKNFVSVGFVTQEFVNDLLKAK